MTLTNPCSATAITTAGTTFTAVSIGVGLTVTRTFTELADTKGTLYNVAALCGVKNYSIVDSNGALVPWASITGSYTITFAPNVDNLHSSGE